MEEVPLPGEVHRHAGLRGRVDDLLVTDRPAWLNDRADAGIDQDLRAIREREERVGSRDAAESPAAFSDDREARKANSKPGGGRRVGSVERPEGTANGNGSIAW